MKLTDIPYLILGVILISLPNPTHAGAEVRHPVTIGVVSPLSGEGAHIGNEMTRVLEIFSEMVATSDTKYKYRFAFEDGKAAVDHSPTTAFHKLLTMDRARLIVTATSGETMQIGPLAQRAKVVVIATYATHPDIKSLGSYIFRTAIDIEKGMSKLADFIRTSQETPIAILTEDHHFTTGASALLSSRLSGSIVSEENYSHEAVDLKPILLRARSRKPKSYYFSCSHPSTCAIITNQARQLGLKGGLYSFLHIDNPAYLSAAGSNANGIKFLALPQAASRSVDFQNLQERYLRKHGMSLGNDFLARATYDAAKALIMAVEEVGPDPQNVRKYLNSYKTEGALGSVSFDHNGDIMGLNYVMKEIKNGRVEIITTVNGGLLPTPATGISQ